jgi:hypothetical protein
MSGGCIMLALMGVLPFSFMDGNIQSSGFEYIVSRCQHRSSSIVREASLRALPEMKQNILYRVAAWQSGPHADDLPLAVVGILEAEGSRFNFSVYEIGVYT